MAGQKVKTTNKVIGKMKASEAIEYMALVGDPRAPKAKTALRKSGRDVELYKLAWPWTQPGADELTFRIREHQYGYFGNVAENPKDVLDITDAGYIAADETLKNRQLRVTLDRLRVADYPGKGEHTVLVEFSAVHVIPGAQKEDLSFSQKYQVSEDSSAGVRGYPVFVGLAVGKEGIALRGRTVNVENAGDKGILKFLEQPVLKRGLELLNAVNPAMPVVTSMVTGITELVLKRNENIMVQSFDLGLDFSNVPSRAYLREGSYIVVQAPDRDWDWSKWQFTRSTGKITHKETKTPIPYNYLVIGISKMA